MPYVCEATGDESHDTCKHCCTCFTCLDDSEEHNIHLREQVTKARDILASQNDLLVNALERMAAGKGVDTMTAKLLTEQGFTVRHAYFSKSEFVKLHQVSEYRTFGAEWDHFWETRKDFPPEWSIVNETVLS